MPTAPGKPQLRLIKNKRPIPRNMRLRICNVIDSCMNGDQLLAARTYYHLYLRRLPLWVRVNEAMFFTYYAQCRCQYLEAMGFSTTPTPPEGA